MGSVMWLEKTKSKYFSTPPER